MQKKEASPKNLGLLVLQFDALPEVMTAARLCMGTPEKENAVAAVSSAASRAEYWPALWTVPGLVLVPPERRRG